MGGYAVQNWRELQAGVLVKGMAVLGAVALTVWYQQVSLPVADLRLVLLVVVGALSLVLITLARPLPIRWRSALCVLGTLAGVGFAHTRLGYGAAAAFYVVPTMLAAVLLPLGSAFAVAILAAVLLDAGQPLGSPALWSLRLTLLSVAALGTAVTYDLRRALWDAWSHVDRMSDLAREVQDRRQEVTRLNDALKVSNGLLRRSLRELAQAQSEAVEAGRLKEQFATTVSHELRTPLNVILGFLEMMQRYPESYQGARWTPELRQDMGEMQMSARYLSELVDDILDLARAQSLQMPVRREMTDLKPLMQEAADVAVRLLLSKKGDVEMRLEVPEGLPPLHLDRTRVRQVLLNLLSNACRFTTAGSITLEAAVEGDAVLVSISDTGRGIPEEELEKVFGEFHQVGERATEGLPGGGKGLGLAIAKRFVTAHGGRIWAERGRTVGSRFCFTLPLEEKEVSMLPPLAAVRLDSEPRHTSLVVVGSESAAAYLRRHVEGVEVVRADSLGEGRRLLRDLHPHALVVSVPPEPDTAVASTAAPLLTDPVPVLQCTLPGSQEPAISPYCDEWLVKPIDRQRLLSCLDGVGPVRRVLIVDDDRSFVRLLERYLSGTGRPLELAVAYEGTSALARARDFDPDVVLLDMALPGLEGNAVARALRPSMSESRRPRIIAITATRPDQGDAGAFARSFTVTSHQGFTEEQVLRLIQGALAHLPAGWLPDIPVAGYGAASTEIPA